jgi:imidazolonepropionase-like amidohydrolase
MRARGEGSPARRAPLALALVALALAPAPLAAQVVAITNAEIHPISGPPIERGTVVLRDGVIEAVGPDVAVPADARVIDAEGRIVTPGFLESATQLGIVEMGIEPGVADAVTTHERTTASFNVLDGFNPHAIAIPITRVEGITRAVVAPGPGATPISGQGVLVDLAGDDLEAMVHRDPVGMFAVLGEQASTRAGGARGAATRFLREALEDARDLANNRSAWEAGDRREYALSRPDLEALAPVLDREVPLVVLAHRASDILAALRLAREFDLRLVVMGGLEGWMVADALREADVPVVVDPMTNLPNLEHLGATLENAARLHAAGVTLALSSFETANARNLKQVAGNAVAHGLPHEAALRAVTLAPAEVWGIADAFGSLEPGKAADVVVWSGDPFELSTRAEHVFIRGEEVPPETRQRELFLRYRELR